MHAPPIPTPEIPAEAARALLEASPLSSCPACGKPMTRRQRACSGRCRATVSRRRHEQRQRERDGRIAGLLRDALRLLEDEQK